MKRALCTMALIGLGVTGCSSGSRKSFSTAPRNESVTDITAAPIPGPAMNTTPQPVAQPVVYDTMTPGMSAPGALASAGSYTVKKGDTLYGIARQHYGDGKQWNKIASANPGLRPETLKVGQTIVVP